jgi:hypothetical protein
VCPTIDSPGRCRAPCGARSCGLRSRGGRRTGCWRVRYGHRFLRVGGDPPSDRLRPTRLARVCRAGGHGVRPHVCGLRTCARRSHQQRVTQDPDGHCLVVFVAANLGGAAPNLTLVLVARVAAALGAAMFTPTASAAVVALAGPERRGRALSLILGGLAVSFRQILPSNPC